MTTALRTKFIIERYMVLLLHYHIAALLFRSAVIALQKNHVQNEIFFLKNVCELSQISIIYVRRVIAKEGIMKESLCR